ncbi:hypothetical protein KJ782_01665 [Patescibacteria group bacterium]|nr:hypothetical protein [Patescibacteria group bacterium]
MGWFNYLKERNLDTVIYGLLIFLYGFGWDYVVDKKIESWSIIGVISYTLFVMVILVRNRKTTGKADPVGRISNISIRKDNIGKMMLAVVLYGLLLYKLFQGIE